MAETTVTKVGQFIKYLISGAAAFGVEYLLFLLLYRKAGMWYIWANSIAMASGFMTSFLLNRFWSFKSDGNWLRQFFLTVVLFFINLMLTNLSLYVFTGYTGLSPVISKVLVMCFIVLWNFVIYKKLIYKK